MAIVAGHTAGMVGADYLRESLGLGLVLLMAADAQGCDFWKCGFEGSGVVGMFGQGSMAGLAGNVGVFALGADLGFLLVAHDAGGLAGVGDGVLADRCQGARTIVTVLAEAFGHDRAANHHEYPESGQQDQGRPDQMSRIAE